MARFASGATVQWGVDATGLERDATGRDRRRSRPRTGRIAAGAVVNAAGAWAGDFASGVWRRPAGDAAAASGGRHGADRRPAGLDADDDLHRRRIPPPRARRPRAAAVADARESPGAPFEMPVDPAWVDAVTAKAHARVPALARRAGRSRGVVGRPLRDVARQARDSRRGAGLFESLPDQRVVGPRRDARAGARAPAGRDHPRRRRVDARHHAAQAVAFCRRATGTRCQSFCNCRLQIADCDREFAAGCTPSGCNRNLQSAILPMPSCSRGAADWPCPTSGQRRQRLSGAGLEQLRPLPARDFHRVVERGLRLVEVGRRFFASRICPRRRCHSAANICWSVERPDAAGRFEQRFGLVRRGSDCSSRSACICR